MRWRKVLSPLGLPALAVICTRENRHLVRGAAVTMATWNPLFPLYLRLESSWLYLYSACLDLSSVDFKSQLLENKLSGINLVLLQKYSSNFFSCALEHSLNDLKTGFSISLIKISAPIWEVICWFGNSGGWVDLWSFNQRPQVRCRSSSQRT